MPRSTNAGIALLLSLSSLMATTALAGEDYSFTEKLFGADAIVLVELKFDRPIPARWPNKQCDNLKRAFPDALAARARRTAKVKEVILGPFNRRLPDGFGPVLASCWWWDAHHRGSAELILFLVGEEGSLQEIAGVEGPETPSPEMLEDLRQVIGWRSLPVAQRVQNARKTLDSKRERLATAAVTTLCLDAPHEVAKWVARAHVEPWSSHPTALAEHCQNAREWQGRTRAGGTP